MNRRHESHERNPFQRDNHDPLITDRPARPIQNYGHAQWPPQPQHSRGPGADVYYGRTERSFDDERSRPDELESDIDDQFDNARSHASRSYAEPSRRGDNSYRMNYGADSVPTRGQPQHFGERSYAGAGERQNFRGKGPKNYIRSDERIREDINEKLTDAPWLDASDISVQVRDGKATLDGSVSDRRLKHRVEDVVERCYGVKDIENRLTVNSGRQSNIEDDRAEDAAQLAPATKKH